MRELPSGTVTFLFTDIEGSTRLLRQRGDAYAAALAEHRKVVRATFGDWGGVEVDAQGDAFFYAFARAGDAVAAAEQVHAALATGPIRIRIGVHTGEPTVTADGYVGVDVHRGARIAAVGHGGQTLLSEQTARLATGVTTKDMGLHRLKDLLGSERLYQLGEADFPPLTSLHRLNLPAHATPFLGRAAELGEVTGVLRRSDVRLVTLTGPGGTGKTRLALQAAAELADEFQDGAWWVSLAAVRDPRLVLPTIASTLGVKDDLSGHVGDRVLLLLLDNLEQVIAVGVELTALLAECRNLKLLVTSREPLRVSAERELAVPPFEESEAVALFRERAHGDQPGPVAEICRRLDCLPLAVELAAARTTILSPAQILERLDQRLPLLTSGTRDAPERHRTLRAAIDWSYELLSDEERALLARLSVFVGGCDIDAAQRVCDADLDGLASLAEKSLLAQRDGRLEMLETILEYARERLEQRGEGDDLEARHIVHYLRLAERAGPELTGREQEAWLERLDRDHGNLRVALSWCAQNTDSGDQGLRLASALTIFWFVRGFYVEGLDHLGRALATSGSDPSRARAGALWGVGLLATLVGDHERAGASLDESLAMARAIGDSACEGRCLVALGLLALFRDDVPAACALLRDGASTARRCGDLWCMADGLGTLGSVLPLQGALDEARAVGTEALAIARHEGDRQGIRMALFGLALAAVRKGDLDAAASEALEGVSICRAIGDPWFVSYFLWILALLRAEQGALADARVHAEESLSVAREAGGALLVVCALEASAAVARAVGDLDRASEFLAEAAAVVAGGNVPASYASAAARERGLLDLARGDASGARTSLEGSLALARRCGDRWAEGRALASLARATGAAGDSPRARALVDEAMLLQQETGDRLGLAESRRFASEVA